jgi:subtilisin family serine protease
MIAGLLAGGAALAGDPNAPLPLPRGPWAPPGFDAGRIAVFVESAPVVTLETFNTPAEVPADLAALGVAPDDVTPTALTGWSIVRMGNESAPAIETSMLVETVAQAAASVDFVSPVYLDEKGDPMLVRPDIFVRFEADVPVEQAEALIAAHVGGYVVERDFATTPGLYLVRSLARDGVTVMEEAAALASLPEVRYAHPDMVISGRKSLIPNDPLFSQQWGLHQTNDMDMDAPEAWDISTGSSSIRVMIMDTGIDQAHPDLNQDPGQTFLPNQGSTNGGPGNVCDNHGTQVAGCVSAKINNGIGCVGVAPNVRSVSAYVFASDVPCSVSGLTTGTALMNALSWAQNNNVRVTNASLSLGSIPTLTAKYAETYAQGMVHFAATGNDGVVGIAYPASLPVVEAVGAIGTNGNRAGFSNYGAGIGVVAPGVNIITTDRVGSAGSSGTDYASNSGTSFASPYAAGVAALILSVNPSLNADDVRLIMHQTAVDRGQAGYDQQYGYGIVNARAALEWVINPPPLPGNFSIVAPSDIDPVMTLSPLLVWTPSANATSYDVVVDDNPQFVNPEISVNVLTNSLVSPVALEPGRTYYMTVTARNLVGSRPSTPALYTFTTGTDCNNNGIDDAAEIAAMTAEDCNGNGIPDTCDLAAGTFRYKSLEYTPIEAVAPQSIEIPNAPAALGPVTLTFTSLSDLSTQSENYDVNLGGPSIGIAYNGSFSDCSAVVDTLVVPAATWNAARLNGTVTINVVPSLGVSATICQTASWVNVEVTYTADSFSEDADQNNVPDECVTSCVCGDSNCDGALTVGDIGYFVTAVTQGQAAWEAQLGGNPSCTYLCANDTNGDGAVTVGDIAAFVAVMTGGSCSN